MRPVVANTFVTLDGVMQAPGGPDEDPTGGFEHGGWVPGHWDDAVGERMSETMNHPFDLLLGRKTYEIFAAHWPYVDDEFARPLNDARKYVASRTLREVTWQNSEVLGGDVVEAVQALKAADGPEIQVHGSADLLQTLIANDLVDVFRLWTFPVIVGGGKRLFAQGAVPRALELTAGEVFQTGVVLATYCRAGAVTTGSFALETPTDAEIERRRKLSGTA